jgi:signal peptide peptidase SppA
VHSIILAIDSPGGTVDGTQALADAVLAARESKPIVTLASGAMASAAYWIGSAAQQVFIADGTTTVGSIGVVATHVDVSGAEAQRGIKTTEIFAGKYKRMASQYAPLTESGRATIQDQVDYTYSLFVSAVASQRGVSEEQVLKDMADGRVFIGAQAVQAGLVDGVSTLAALVAQLNQQRSAGAARALNPKPKPQGATTMPLTRAQLEAEAPDVLAAILAEGAAAGANAERERIQGIEAQLIPGHEALIGKLKFDGSSTPGDAAMAVNAAERGLRISNARALADDAPQPVPTVAANPLPDATPSRAQIDAKAKAYQAAHPGTDYVAAVKAVSEMAAA